MIRLALYKELQAVSHLMLSVFRDKMKDEYTQEGVANIEVEISLSSLEKRFFKGSLFYTYLDDGELQGVVELEKPCHIAYVFSKIENRGIATALCTASLEKSTEKYCTVGAFSGAKGFYERLGFISLAEKKVINGLEFTLMAKFL